MNKLEYVIIRTGTARGNTTNRETMLFFVQFEDGKVELVPYSVAYVTEAFEVYCSGYILVVFYSSLAVLHSTLHGRRNRTH